MPSFTSGWPSLAVLLAIRMVQESASSHPPPSANPLIAQIEGLPIVSNKWKTLCPYSENSFPFTDVCTGHKCFLTCTRQNQDANVYIIARIEKGLMQLLDSFAVQRVQHLRP